MLTVEMLRQNTSLAGLTDAQLTAIATMSQNDENTVIGTRIGALHGQYDADILSITGIKKNDGEKVSYTYDIYDFDMVKLYENAKQIKDQELGKFDELRPVEDAVRHMKKGSEATLLIPSALAFGSYGDNDKISSDMPIIVKIKTL